MNTTQTNSTEHVPQTRGRAVPGPRSPAAVQTAMYLSRPEKFLRDCHARYGDVFAIHTIVFGPEVCIVRPEMIKRIFTGDADALHAGEANAALGPLVGDKSVLLLDGKEHLRQRRLLMPPFHGERMLAYKHAMSEITHRAIDAWKPGTRFEIHEEMQAITLDVILRTIFGADADDDLTAPLRSALTNVLAFLASPFTMVGTIPVLRRDAWGLSPWARFRRSIEAVDALIQKQIERRRAEKDSASRTDVLTMLLSARDEEGNAMSDAELRDELVTLLVAGHETTATELSWVFDCILHDRRVRLRLVDEIESARVKGASRDDALDTDRMPYVDATIKEVLRLHPVIPAVGRMVKRPFSLDGFDIREGTLLVPAVWLTHRLADVYPDPEAFRPERFLDVRPDPYSFLPFGGGIRRCIGMAFALFEMKVVLATILSRVRLRPRRDAPSEVSLRGFTHAPKGGVEVMLD